jgi:hypothetical protein
MQRKDKSPHQMRHKVMREARPSSSKMLHTPRPPPKNGTGKVRMLANNYFAFYPNNIGTNYYPNITNTNNTCISIFLTILLTLV